MKYAELKNYDQVYNAVIALVNRTSNEVPLHTFCQAIAVVLREKLLIKSVFSFAENDRVIFPVYGNLYPKSKEAKNGGPK